MNEWKWINGYEEYYKIYKNGDVESYKGKKPKVLKVSLTRGYKSLKLCKNGQRQNFYIHRLIAIHFIPNPNKFKYIDHIDRNPLNNNLTNLRWITNGLNVMNTNNNGKYMKGVKFDKRRNIFEAKITLNYKTKYLGSYKSELEAHEAYIKEYNIIFHNFTSSCSLLL